MSDVPIFQLPTLHSFLVCAARLGVAAFLGGLLGLQREWVHSTAGLRTHILVSLGSALFVLSAVVAEASPSDVSRVVQGLVAGIGFLGAGTILKVGDRMEVHGLTTAASIWLTAGVGTGAGLGHLWLPILGAALGLLTLGPIGTWEKRRKKPVA